MAMEIEFDVKTIINNLKEHGVYKDECVRCFTENTDIDGVNICLTTYEAFCHEHTMDYVKSTGNKVFLNYRVIVEKIDPNPDQPQVITKLAIGVEGGIDLNREKRTPVCRVWKFGDPEYSLANSDELMAFVISSDSEYKKTEVAAWEQEIKECPHTKNLVQNLGAYNPKTPKCNSCDLTENLWLCLTTGHVGCGRRNYDGSGGNGHAKEYFEANGHPVCVKSGTISPEGNASVFCYACDEDVKVPDLPEKLAALGIDIQSSVKTEKTMVEINLERNLTLSLSKAFEQGMQLELTSGRGKTGLENIGNSCYLNSVVQCLFNIQEVSDRYFKEGQNFLGKTHRTLSSCLVSQTCKLAHGIMSGKFGEIKEEEIVVPTTGEKTTNQIQDGIKPYMFRKLVGKGHLEFQTNRQQDAMEYLIHLLNTLGKQENNFGLSETSELFKFTQESRYFPAGEQNKVKISEIQAKYINLQVPKPEGLAGWTQATEVEDMEYKADFKDCLQLYTQEKAVGLSKQSRGLKTFPKYLIVQVENFVLNGWTPIKLHCDLQMDYDNIDLSGLKLHDLPAEIIQEKEDEPSLPPVDDILLMEIMSMGYSENRARRALMESGNDIENALNWIFSCMDDDSLDGPIVQVKKQEFDINTPREKKAASTSKVDSAMLSEVMMIAGDMGISREQAEIALEIKPSPDAAINYLFENMHEIERILQERQNAPKNEFEETMNLEDQEQSQNTCYEVIGSVIHLGKSIHVGHYVAYARKDDGWVYCNDSKIAKSLDPKLGKSYIFFLRRKQH